MIGRIRERFCLRRRNTPRKKTPCAALHGSAHNIIVVKAPHELFTEAIFILRDDYYLSPAASSAELLRQARAAAEGCTAAVSVRDRRKNIWLLILASLLILETAGMIFLTC